MIDFAHPQVMEVIMTDESAGQSTEQRERAGRPWSEVNESVSGRTRPATTNLGSPELDLYPNWLLQERCWGDPPRGRTDRRRYLEWQGRRKLCKIKVIRIRTRVWASGSAARFKVWLVLVAPRWLGGVGQRCLLWFALLFCFVGFSRLCFGRLRAQGTWQSSQTRD